MSTQTENAKKYDATMATLVAQLWAKDGSRLFDTNGGATEGERIAKILDDTKSVHPRSKCFKSAMTVWAKLIRETVETDPENLDWAVLQGCTYAGWELPTVPLEAEPNLDELADEDL